MEYIDVLDENGKKLNIVRNLRLIYELANWHRSVHVWVLNSKNELLIQKRALTKETFPGLWAISIAGHVRSGEESLDAAIREIKEEISLDIDTNKLKYLFSIKRSQPYKDRTLNVHDDIYILNVDLDVSTLAIQKEELSELKFINYKEYEQLLKNNDPSFVPYSEEHKLLFEYLDRRGD